METKRKRTSIASTRFNPDKSIITVMYGNGNGNTTTRISRVKILKDLDLLEIRKRRMSLNKRIEINSILKTIRFIKSYYQIY